MSRDINLLHPRLRRIIPQIIAECKAQGLPVLVTQTLRTKAEQDALYAQGRTKPGNIVTNVWYPNSAHCWGVAFDFCRNVKGREYDDSDGFFAKVAAIAKPYGLTWGGDWKNFVDKPHLELTEFMPGASVAWLIRTYGTPEVFQKSWALEDDDEMQRYKTVAELPEWAQATVSKLVGRGIIAGTGDGEIDLSTDMARMLVWLDRAGVFGE